MVSEKAWWLAPAIHPPEVTCRNGQGKEKGLTTIWLSRHRWCKSIWTHPWRHQRKSRQGRCTLSQGKEKRRVILRIRIIRHIMTWCSTYKILLTMHRSHSKRCSRQWVNLSLFLLRASTLAAMDLCRACSTVWKCFQNCSMLELSQLDKLILHQSVKISHFTAAVSFARWFIINYLIESISLSTQRYRKSELVITCLEERQLFN